MNLTKYSGTKEHELRLYFVLLTITSEMEVIHKSLVEYYKTEKPSDEKLTELIQFCSDLLQFKETKVEEFAKQAADLLITSEPKSDKIEDCANLLVLADYLDFDMKEAVYDFQQRCL